MSPPSAEVASPAVATPQCGGFEAANRRPLHAWLVRSICGAALWIPIAVSFTRPEGTVGTFLARLAGPAMLAVLCLTTAGVGRLIRRRCTGDSFGKLEALCCDVALGWAVLGVGLTLLAACHLFLVPLMAALALALFLCCGIGPFDAASGWNAWAEVPWRRLAGLALRHRACRIPLILTCLLWADALLWALGPVWDWDSEMYHLSCAEFLLQNRGLAVSTFDPLMNIPGQMYVWYGFGIAAGQQNFPALLMWCATILTSILAGSFAARRIGTTVGLWTIPVFWSGAIVTAVAITPRVEPYCALMFMTALSLLYPAIRSEERLRLGPFVLAGLCLGTAGASKYQALYGWVVLAGWLGWLWVTNRSLRNARSLVAGLLLLAAALLVNAPWWGKNLVAFGNPFYPVGAHGDPSSLTHAQTFEAARPGSLWAFLKMAPEIFLTPNAFNGGPNHFPHYLFLLFPLVLLLRPPRAVSWLAWIAVGYYALNMCLTPITRYLLPSFALFSICTAWVIVQLAARLQMRALFPGLAALMIAHALLIPARAYATPTLLAYLGGLKSEAEFLIDTNKSGFYEAAAWINENTPEDATVLMCWDARQFRIRRRTIIDPGFATWSGLFMDGRSTAAGISSFLKSRDVDYLLVNEGKLEFDVAISKRLPPETLEAFQRQREILLGTVLEPVLASRRVTIYKVLAPKTVAKAGSQVSHGS